MFRLSRVATRTLPICRVPSSASFSSIARTRNVANVVVGGHFSLSSLSRNIRLFSTSRPWSEQQEVSESVQSSEAKSQDQSTSVYLGNLPWATTEGEISDTASHYGSIAVRSATDSTGRPLGFAHIDFPSTEAAQSFMSAVENGEVRFGDRVQRVDFARRHRPVESRKDERPLSQPSKTLYLANLLYSTDESDIREVMEPFGEITRVTIAYDADRVPRGFAHVQFASQEAASEVVKHTPLFCAGRRLRIDFAPDRRPGQVGKHPPSHKLYFYDYYGEESELREAFMNIEHRILSFHFLRDRQTQKHTGNGFIEFVSVEDATSALEGLNGAKTPSGTSVLKLSYASPPKNQPRNDDYESRRPFSDNRRSQQRRY